MNRDELLDTIQRLLALSASSNEHESAAALSRAGDLMARHNISMLEVENKQNNESKPEYVTENVWSGGRSQNTEPFLCDILQKYFFVRSISVRNYNTRLTTLKFFGDKTNVEIARYAYKFLDYKFKELADQNNIRARDRRTYYAGLSTGFKNKLKEERDSLNKQSANNCNALVLVDQELVREFHNTFKNLKNKKSAAISGNMSAYNQGLQDGRNINLRNGIEGKVNQGLLK